MNEMQCFCDECEKAMAYAEQRIIKLLETYDAEIRRDGLIALINGENVNE